MLEFGAIKDLIGLRMQGANYYEDGLKRLLSCQIKNAVVSYAIKNYERGGTDGKNNPAHRGTGCGSIFTESMDRT